MFENEDSTMGMLAGNVIACHVMPAIDGKRCGAFD